MAELIQEVEWYLERLEGVEGGEGQWNAWCPCHDDVGTEWKGLSITVKKNKVLIKCHSCGAQMPDVYEVLSGDDWGSGNGNGDVNVHVTRAHVNEHAPAANGDAPDGMRWWEGHTGVEREVWEQIGCVPDGAGVAFTFAHDPAVKKIRKPPKDIAWIGTDQASAPPLWPMPPDELPEHVSIVEGESDCGTAHAANLPFAFATTKGAKAQFPTGWADALKERGVRRLTVCGDTDEGGREFAARVAREAVAAGLAVEIVRLETVLDPFSGINDLNGVWQACETSAEFLEVVGRATQRVAERMVFRTVDEMEVVASQEIDWYIPDLIAPGDKVMIAAPQKSLKSWVALELTRSLVTGDAFLKRAEWVPTQTRNVGFVQEEGAPSLWARRVHMLRITGNDKAIFSHRTGFRFTESSYVDEIISAARDAALDVLIFDPLQRMLPGVNENDASETGIVWDEVFRIQQALPHLVVLIVHHANKHNRLSWESIRGSGRHAGEVDLGIFLERHPFEDNTLRMWMDGRDIPQYLGTGECFDVKYSIDRDQRLFEMDATEITVNTNLPQVVTGNKNREKVLAAVAKGCDTRTKIQEDTDLSDVTVRDHLVKLTEDGEITETDNGKGRAKTYTVNTGGE